MSSTVCFSWVILSNGVYLRYSLKSVSLMSPFFLSVSCMAKAAVIDWGSWPLSAMRRYSRSNGR